MKNSPIRTALAAAIVSARGRCRGPSGKISGPDGREQQDEQGDEDRDVGSDGNDVTTHEWTSIK